MRPWQLLASESLPDGNETLRLYRRGDEYAIKVGPVQLMNSRMHGSEEALAELGCRDIAGQEGAAILVGGLGMGYTLAATLRQCRADATVTVAELSPSVIDWNRDHLGHLADHPLDDPRVTLYSGDIADCLRQPRQAFDAILLDVDNGPDALTQQENNWFYSEAGLGTILSALRPGGALAVWSEGGSPEFSKRLRRVGFRVEEHHPRFHGRGRGGRHTVWVAQRR